MLVAIGVTGNIEDLWDPKLGIETVKGHIKADPNNGYATTAKGIYAVGDVIGPPGWRTSPTTRRSAASNGSASTPTARSTTRPSPAARIPTRGSPASA